MDGWYRFPTYNKLFTERSTKIFEDLRCNSESNFHSGEQWRKQDGDEADQEARLRPDGDHQEGRQLLETNKTKWNKKWCYNWELFNYDAFCDYFDKLFVFFLMTMDFHNISLDFTLLNKNLIARFYKCSLMLFYILTLYICINIQH